MAKELRGLRLYLKVLIMENQVVLWWVWYFKSWVFWRNGAPFIVFVRVSNCVMDYSSCSPIKKTVTRCRSSIPFSGYKLSLNKSPKRGMSLFLLLFFYVPVALFKFAVLWFARWKLRWLVFVTTSGWVHTLGTGTIHPH